MATEIAPSLHDEVIGQRLALQGLIVRRVARAWQQRVKEWHIDRVIENVGPVGVFHDDDDNTLDGA